MSPWKPLAIAYAVIAVVTFSLCPLDDSAAVFQALLWPLYWSWEAWS